MMAEKRFFYSVNVKLNGLPGFAQPGPNVVLGL